MSSTGGANDDAAYTLRLVRASLGLVADLGREGSICPNVELPIPMFPLWTSNNETGTGFPNMTTWTQAELAERLQYARDMEFKNSPWAMLCVIHYELRDRRATVRDSRCTWAFNEGIYNTCEIRKIVYRFDESAS